MRLTCLLLVSIVFALGCTAEEGERCGQDVGCAAGLYCQGDPLEDRRDPGADMQCATLRHPDDGICHAAKPQFARCDGYWGECADGLRCVGGVCQATGLSRDADPCR